MLAIRNHYRFMSREKQSVVKSMLGRMGAGADAEWIAKGDATIRRLLESCFHYLYVVPLGTGLVW